MRRPRLPPGDVGEVAERTGRAVVAERNRQIRSAVLVRDDKEERGIVCCTRQRDDDILIRS